MALFGSEAQKAFNRGEFLRAGDLFKAEGELEKALQSYIKGGDILAAARLREEMGQPAASVDLYLRAGDRDSAVRILAESGDYLKAARVCAEGGDLPRAATFAERGRDLLSAAAYYEKMGRFWEASELSQRAGNIEETLRLLDLAVAQLPTEEGLGPDEVEHVRDRRRQAAHRFEVCKSPVWAGHLYEGLGELHDAVRCFAQAGDEEKVAELNARLGRRAGSGSPGAPSAPAAPAPPPSVDEEELLSDAERYERGGNLLAAADLRREVRDFESAGNLYFRAGDFRRAGDCFRSAFLYTMAAQAYGKAGDRSLALQMAVEGGQWEDAFAIARGDGKLLQEFIHGAQRAGAGGAAGHPASLLVGRAFLEMGQPEMALHLLEARGELFEESPTWAHYLGGRAHEALGRAEEAATEYKRVLTREIAFQDTAQRLKALGSTSSSLVAGRYEILDELGRGGMGEVFRVRDTKLDEVVALKTLRPRTELSEVDRARFLNEIKLSRKITHPNVVRVFDLGSWGDLTFLTMEFVEGPTLSRWVRDGEWGRSSLGDRVEILKGVAAGLAEAHRLGIIHRDLKPQNVILGPGAVPKVLDFGIATARECSDLTQDGHFVGSPKYVSPEQVQGLASTARSDIYSFGLLAYYLLTGEDAFTGDKPALILLAQLRQEPPAVSSRVRVPKSLDRLVAWCLSKNPAERPASLREVLKALEEIA